MISASGTSTSLELAKRNEQKLSIIAIDIDHFKKINDTYGHSVGDEVLITIANILKQNIRKSDIVSRFGGEEFVILLNNASLDDATSIAEKIRVTIENSSIDIEGTVIKVTSSFGVASYNKDRENSIETVIKRADDLLYIAKKHGRNQVVNSL